MHSSISPTWLPWQKVQRFITLYRHLCGSWNFPKLRSLFAQSDTWGNTGDNFKIHVISWFFFFFQNLFSKLLYPMIPYRCPKSMISFVQNVVMFFFFQKMKKEKTENKEKSVKKSLLLLGLYISPPHTPWASFHHSFRGWGGTQLHTDSHTHAQKVEQGPKSFLTASLLRVPGGRSAGTDWGLSLAVGSVTERRPTSIWSWPAAPSGWGCLTLGCEKPAADSVWRPGHLSLF